MCVNAEKHGATYVSKASLEPARALVMSGPKATWKRSVIHAYFHRKQTQSEEIPETTNPGPTKRPMSHKLQPERRCFCRFIECLQKLCGDGAREVPEQQIQPRPGGSDQSLIALAHLHTLLYRCEFVFGDHSHTPLHALEEIKLSANMHSDQPY